MRNINVGIINRIVSKKISDSYLNTNSLNESKNVVSFFFETINNSPLLQLESKIHDNLEKKYINNDTLAKEYITNNIKLFETYTLEELNSEHNKLKGFIDETYDDISTEKIKLHESINTLLTESLKYGDKINVNEMHDAFTLIFNHIKTTKINVPETIDEDVEIIDDVIELAINKFNTKYANLNESDKNLIYKLINSNDKDKETILENYKSEVLTILENSNESGDNLNKAILKIKEMVYNLKNVDDNIIQLHSFKKELL